MKAFVCLVFPSSVHSITPEESTPATTKSTEQEIITSLTHGVMTGNLACSYLATFSFVSIFQNCNVLISSCVRLIVIYTVDDYFHCVEQGRAAITPLSNILKKKMRSQSAGGNYSSKAA